MNDMEPKKTPREIFTHQVAGAPEVRVFVMDEPGPGGANHEYQVLCLSHEPSFTEIRCSEAIATYHTTIKFQKGGVAEVGQNGVTNEALLAIVIDRLKCFQAGPFACEENAAALDFITEALDYLKNRTRQRVARGVEGRQEK